MSTIITALLIIISTIAIPLIFILIKKKKNKKRNETFLKLFSQEGLNKDYLFQARNY